MHSNFQSLYSRHILPKFKVPLQTDKDVENWLNFYEMDGPFTCLSVLVSNDPVSIFSNMIPFA